MPSPVVVAEVVRSGFLEGRHHGSAVALDADGALSWSVGDPGPFLPRSCNKPLQALAMLGLGLDLPPDLLAIASASHSGEPMHLDAVRRVLALGGLDETALQTPPALPGDEAARAAVLRAGGSAAPVYMDCSGKHAAMLLTCVVNDWSTHDYLALDHPLQRGILLAFGAVTGEPVTTVAVDGCGAPLLSTSLVGLGTAFRSLAVAPSGSPAGRVADAIRTHPELVSGTTRDELRLLRAVPTLIGKAGAEAAQVVALPDGRAWVVKIDDGGERARPVLLATALLRDGVGRLPGVDVPALEALATAPLLGGGVPVGEVRAVL